MNENSTHTDLLIQYLDGELQGEQLSAIKKDIQENPSSREELENLRLAKEAARSYGLKTRIGSIHNEMMHELKKTGVPKSNVISMVSQYGLRVAAVLIILFGISALYQYITATPEKLFSENFHAFDLRITRGSSDNSLEDLYEKGDMSGLIQQFTQMKSPGAKDYFLAGNAFLSTHQPTLAIQAFISLEQLNKSKNTHYFEEDAEYYLALSYLADHETSKALLIFEKIHANPNHPYHSAISSWFLSKIKRANRS
jgi:hypothetical protein